MKDLFLNFIYPTMADLGDKLSRTLPHPKRQIALLNIFFRSLPRGHGTFVFDTKVPKKSRKNDASPLEANAWPAVLSGQRSWAREKWVGVGVNNRRSVYHYHC